MPVKEVEPTATSTVAAVCQAVAFRPGATDVAAGHRSGAVVRACYVFPSVGIYAVHVSGCDVVWACWQRGGRVLPGGVVLPGHEGGGGSVHTFSQRLPHVFTLLHMCR